MTIICADCGRAVDSGPHLCQPGGQDVCDRCNQPVRLVTGHENGQPWQSWNHAEIADDVFCGLVMHAADRPAGR
jgi:hypothetical protein